MMAELVVLVDENDNELGVMPKDAVHHQDTPLHRAFSVFVYREDGQFLVQQRALSKKTWPGVWSNSCCGHPLPGESREEAVQRRVKYELGIGLTDLRKVSDYRYRFERNGVVENEICPVFVAKTRDVVQPNPSEVANYRWVEWEAWLSELEADRVNVWSEWCKEEAALVNPLMTSWGKPTLDPVEAR